MIENFSQKCNDLEDNDWEFVHKYPIREVFWDSNENNEIMKWRNGTIDQFEKVKENYYYKVRKKIELSYIR
jgi:hypothetical protein